MNRIFIAIVSVLFLQTSVVAFAQNAGASQRLPSPQQLSDKDPNHIPETYFRLLEKAARGGNDFSIAVTLWPADCSNCRLQSRVTQATELLTVTGELVKASSLKSNHTYRALGVRFKEASSSEIDALYLSPGQEWGE